jgi:hypothetical protein
MGNGDSFLCRRLIPSVAESHRQPIQLRISPARTLPDLARQWNGSNRPTYPAVRSSTSIVPSGIGRECRSDCITEDRMKTAIFVSYVAMAIATVGAQASTIPISGSAFWIASSQDGYTFSFSGPGLSVESATADTGGPFFTPQTPSSISHRSCRRTTIFAAFARVVSLLAL